MAAEDQTDQRVFYGFDAPDEMRAMFAAGSATTVLGIAIARHSTPAWRPAFGSAVGMTFALGVSLGAYALRGKYRSRDALIDFAALRGDERVLDVGTGRGLLAVAAAKQLERGTVDAIDIWRLDDPSGNTVFAARANAVAEGVADRIDFHVADARTLPFLDATFDAAVSLMCLHEIPAAAERAHACHEIARVVRPGGRVVIGDRQPANAYANALEAAGMLVEWSAPAFATALTPMWFVVASKPEFDEPQAAVIVA